MFVNTNTGGRLDSSTMMVKLLVTLNAPFDTLTATEFVVGPCASSGVQLMTPVFGLIVIRFVSVTFNKFTLGTFVTIAYVNGNGGVFGSVAWQVTVNGVVSM